MIAAVRVRVRVRVGITTSVVRSSSNKRGRKTRKGGRGAKTERSQTYFVGARERVRNGFKLREVAVNHYECDCCDCCVILLLSAWASGG